MKKINILAFSLVLAFSFSSCTKNKLGESTFIIPNVETSNSKDKGNLSIVVNSYSFSNEFPVSIDVKGAFKDENGKLIELDKLTVGDIQINKDVNGNYYSHFNKYTNKDDFPNIVNSLSGKEVNIEIEDSKFGDSFSSIYASTPIQLEMPNGTAGILNKAEGLKIKWNPISNGTVGTRSDVQVGAAVVYHPEMTKFRTNQTSLPVEKTISVSKTAQDSDAEIYFTPEDLNGMPTSGIAVVYIGRGEQLVVEYNITNNILTYVTSSSSEELTIQ